MIRDSWWWPWWVSSLIDLAVVAAALLLFRFTGRRALRILAAALVVAGSVGRSDARRAVDDGRRLMRRS
jgi:hypothetical protein